MARQKSDQVAKGAMTRQHHTPLTASEVLGGIERNDGAIGEIGNRAAAVGGAD